MATAAAAVLAKARRDVVSHFVAHDALEPGSAVAFAPARRVQARMLGRLIRKGVVVESAPGRYFLDRRALDTARRQARTRVAIALGVLAVGAGAAALW